MNRRVILAAAALMSAFPAAASFPSCTWLLQDSAPSQSQPTTPSREEPKKTKKVWTNDNLGDISGSAISQLGDEPNSWPGKSATAKPASSQVIAPFRKQLTTLQA